MCGDYVICAPDRILYPFKTLGMPNWEEETGEAASQRNARIWSVNYLLDSFNFLIDYGIYIPRQKISVSEAACTTHGTAIGGGKGDDFLYSVPPTQLPAAMPAYLRYREHRWLVSRRLFGSNDGWEKQLRPRGLLTWSVLVFVTVIYPHTLQSDYMFP